jgi:hypothetical protein
MAAPLRGAADRTRAAREAAVSACWAVAAGSAANPACRRVGDRQEHANGTDGTRDGCATGGLRRQVLSRGVRVHATAGTGCAPSVKADRIPSPSIGHRPSVDAS